MPISRFEQVQRATNLGFSRFAMSLPLLVILLVAVLGKWDRDRGSHEVTTGLLGFTSYWVQKIGNLLTGRR